MIFYIHYTADSFSVFNKENVSCPNYWEDGLGFIGCDLDPLHQAREVRRLLKKAKRWGMNPKRMEVLKKEVLYALRAKEHISFESWIK